MTRSELKRVDGILHKRGSYTFQPKNDRELYITFDKNSRTMPYSLKYNDTLETITCTNTIKDMEYLLVD